jgi:hypothetical protein
VLEYYAKLTKYAEHQQPLTEVLTHFFKEGLVAFARTGFEIIGIPQPLHHLLFFRSKCLWSPNIDIDEQITFEIGIQLGKTFAF